MDAATGHGRLGQAVRDVVARPHERPIDGAWGEPVNLREPKRHRAKLWELNSSIHCSVIGTCLTTGELRSAMGKVLQQDVSGFNDHDLHGRAVGLCERQGDPARLLHKTLDRRHELAIRRFGRLCGEEAVMQAWAEARREGDIPGAYWAVLTHPDTGHTGIRKAFGDVHMLSHLVGASNRADIRRLAALEEENAALRAKVDRQQARFHQTTAAHDATVQRLSGLAVRRIADEQQDAADDALSGLRHLVTDLQRRSEREASRRARLEQRLGEAVTTLETCGSRATLAEARAEAAEREVFLLERNTSGKPVAPVALPPLHILYVGGRPGAIHHMRAALDEAGGSIREHDGGRHDHPSLLPGLIGQADLVVFPVDCVSHDAALTIKRLCRQQSKRWAPLRTSGLGSFLAALAPQPSQEIQP